MQRRSLGLIIGVMALFAVVGIGVTQLQGKSDTGSAYSADVIAALSSGDTSGFARALTVRDFKFPQDYGAHPDFQTEWWYYTGNVATADGRRFGYELTIFRRSLTPTAPERSSAWATNQLYLADFALTDVAGNKFYNTGRLSRGTTGLAGAVITPDVRVWLENWSMEAQNPDATTMRLRADAGSDAPIALDLTTIQRKAPVLEGDRGLSAKSPTPGNASYYYSLTRLDTSGTLTVNGTPYTVTGNSWMDHEFSTSSLSKNAVGWDWFSLQLSDNREIMLYRIRLSDGTTESTSDGTLINADGSSESFTLAQFKIEPQATWRSPLSGAQYPSKWHLTVTPKTGAPITLDVTPLMSDQELHATGTYWEGASSISGMQGSTPFSGYGYVELTGYQPIAAGDSSKLPGSAQ